MGDTENDGGDAACWLEQVCPECGRLRASCGHDEVAAPSPSAVRRPGRDRDAAGRARNGRPRDGLGRPLPYGAQGAPRQPEGVHRSPGQTLTEAQQLLDAGMPFHAHEVLEDRWKAAPEPERPLWRALAQYAVGLTHAARGNPTGAAALLARAADGLAPFEAAPPFDLDIAGIRRWAGQPAAVSTTVPAPEAPALRRLR
ncbi:hypothetical protein F4556_006861 [Kitasatospora gansuensis]|uniref:DUF309 domain-containing protein n=1 Tax=Kitasatospora gansuensis TaxID=258050 RepID=A0A7W7SL71_9ACTN|nr:DUF309 domain-containing protein [Kitasatospora gansuensis]MBB4951326.1 hypothetical protein [Kitasatospora gansuensis]